MSDIKLISRMLEKYKNQITSIIIDEFGYCVYEVLGITTKTKGTDTVIIGYSTYYNYSDNEVMADTHLITLNDLEGADTIILSKDEEICRIL